MGKGDTQRPTQITDRELAQRWCGTFGHRVPVTPEGRYGQWRCLACGAEGSVPGPPGANNT